MHWIQFTEIHKLNDFISIKLIFKDIKNWHHCLIQNFSNADVADFEPPKNRLPAGILKFRKNVLIQKVLDYSKQKQYGIVLFFQYLMQLTAGPGLKEAQYNWMLDWARKLKMPKLKARYLSNHTTQILQILYRYSLIPIDCPKKVKFKILENLKNGTALGGHNSEKFLVTYPQLLICCF